MIAAGIARVRSECPVLLSLWLNLHQRLAALVDPVAAGQWKDLAYTAGGLPA